MNEYFDELNPINNNKTCAFQTIIEKENERLHKIIDEERSEKSKVQPNFQKNPFIFHRQNIMYNFLNTLTDNTDILITNDFKYLLLSNKYSTKMYEISNRKELDYSKSFLEEGYQRLSRMIVGDYVVSFYKIYKL